MDSGFNRQASTPPATTRSARNPIIAGRKASYRTAAALAPVVVPACGEISGFGAAAFSKSSSASNRPRVKYETAANSNGATAAAATTPPETLKYQLCDRIRNIPTREASTV